MLITKYINIFIIILITIYYGFKDALLLNYLNKYDHIHEIHKYNFISNYVNFIKQYCNYF